jgi:type VI secretion system protein ImpA
MPNADDYLQPLLGAEPLLQPIPGACPSGLPLRHEPAYEDIRQAMRPADTAPSGVWQRDQKLTDWQGIIDRASHVLATQSKDLDIAVWLTEALVRKQGIVALPEGIRLIRDLLERFWDTIYPSIEDGDEGFRARPINHLNKAFVATFTMWPISQNGLTLYDQRTSRTERKPPQEEIDEAVKATPRQFYERRLEELVQAREAVTLLQNTCQARFKTADRPDLGKLLDQLGDVQNAMQQYLRQTPAMAPPAALPAKPAATLVVPPSAPEEPLDVRESLHAQQSAVAGPAVHGIHELAAGLRRADPSDPVPYMLVRSWCFGPLLASGSPVDETRLEPPSTELRTALRRLVREKDWWEVLEKTESAMKLPCAPCWLDLHRHAFRACTELGHRGAASGIRGILAGYLHALPDLPAAMMLDGSPTASSETALWLRDEVLGGARGFIEDAQEPLSTAQEQPDAFEAAQAELRAGRFNEAFRLLTEALAQEESGRGKMQRKLQLARISMTAGHHRLALPILREIDQIVEEHHLECWETRELIASHLETLYRCLDALQESSGYKEKVYGRLCAVDPLKALELAAKQ